MPETAGTGALSRGEVREHVAELLQESAAEIGDEDDLLDWGLDSMRIMALVEKLRARGVQVGFADLGETTTLRQWWEVLGL
ncbi:hypothetical protein GCM10027174_26210 [Salinifilum aidingensis]